MGNSLLNKFNGVDVDQTQDDVKMHCSSYIDRMLEAHKWNSGHPNESQRANIEPLPASIMTDLGFSSTTHERNIYEGTIDGHRVLVCRQVDDLAVACDDSEVAKKVIAMIRE